MSQVVPGQFDDAEETGRYETLLSDNIIQRQKSVFTKLYVPINTESVQHRVEHIQTVSGLLKT